LTKLASRNRDVNGQNILYHYIQKNILSETDEFSKELLKRLLVDLSIWIPPSFYRKLPIILPYVVRDNSCRAKKPTGEDEWGSANSGGFLRDDNSLLKGIVRSFTIRSPKISEYDGNKLGTGFVASHIWGKVTVGNTVLISSRHHMLNSFVPNLVWLPVQISKLTDREGSFAQRLLQAISHRIYREISLPNDLLKIWDALPYPEELQNISIDVGQLNYFDVPAEWLTKRINGLIQETEKISSIDTFGEKIQHKVKSSRYLPTLNQLSVEERAELNIWLSKYATLLRN
jgi:hypothetical protein